MVGTSAWTCKQYWNGLAGCGDLAAERNVMDVLVISLQKDAEDLSYTPGEDVANASSWQDVRCPLAINSALDTFVDLLAYEAAACAITYAGR